MDGEAIDLGCLLVEFTAGVVVLLWGFSAESDPCLGHKCIDHLAGSHTAADASRRGESGAV
jgi:hypothetical protein